MTGGAGPRGRGRWFVGGVLAAIAAASALVAEQVHRWAAPEIALARAAAERRAVEDVLPALAGTPWQERARMHAVGKGRHWIVPAVPATGGARVAAPWRASHGYNGDISLAIAVDAEGRVIRVQVIGHRETPGLGDRMERRHTGWLDQFAGRSLESPPPPGWGLARDGGAFDGLTGATVTARAVVNGVREALESAALPASPSALTH